MITLALDTSTPRGSVALLRDDETVSEIFFTRERSADGLFDAIAGVLRGGTGTNGSNEKCSGNVPGMFRQVPDLIAVGLGPGSFTGIRAGIAAARGLALPRGTPVVGVCSFDATALSALRAMPGDAEILCVWSEARRGEVYRALFGRDGRVVRGCEICARESLGDGLAGKVFLAGPEFTPGAAAAGRLAREKFLANGRVGDARLEPVYLRATEYRRCADSTGAASVGMLGT
jgi:tRNA threonylcarbamoyladenosine biosynthesis protein TsaB